MSKRGINLDIQSAQIKSNIAENLKHLRKTYKLTQQNVSDVLGIDCASYRNWENERSIPSVAMLYEIAKIYKVSINELCGIETDETNLSVASTNDFNKKVYGESRITELDAYEKQLIMQMRRLTNEDKRKVGKYINDIINNDDKE